MRDASYAIFLSERPGEVVLVFTATLVADETTQPRGALSTGRFDDLPVLHEDADSLLRFTFNGGAGVYADHNPWFASPATYTGRSPIARDPPGAGWASWGEAWVEYGIAGATRLGDTRAYAYGELTALTSGATGQDLFRSDTRTKTLPEKAYAGLLWARPGTQRSARVSVGRQNWQLERRFPVLEVLRRRERGPQSGPLPQPPHHVRNDGARRGQVGRFRAEYFDVDPAELKDFDSGTRFQGVHLSWIDKASWDLGVTAYRVPESNTVLRSPQGGVVPRDGQRTWNLRAGHRGVAGVPGLSALAEYAQQSHRGRRGAGERLVRAARLHGTRMGVAPEPDLPVRALPGDDPNTARYEAFDAPLSSGLDEWVQGINFKKVVTNSNVDSHRIRFNVAPTERSTTRRLVPSAGERSLVTGERAYGDELDFAVRWAISKRLFFLGVAGVAWPDDG